MATSAVITGASGLIGSHVLRNWNIEELDPVPLRRSDGDLLEPGVPTSLVEKLKPAVVIHLAWTASGTRDYRSSDEQPKWLEATLELEQACRDHGALLVATGTALDTDDSAGDAYSFAKAQLRLRLARAIAAEEITWLRPYYVFDAERRRPVLVADALAALDLGQPLELRTPNSQHDFVDAHDVATAVLAAVRHDLRGIVPIGTGQTRFVHELIEALGVEWVPTIGADKLGPQYHEAADMRRLRALGWTPYQTERLFRGG